MHIPPLMPRKPTPKTSEFPFHICARSNNRDWFTLPMTDCWKIFTTCLKKVALNYGFETHAFVLMSNHYHWLVSTPNENLGEGMCYFQTQASWALARQSKRINRIFGARYNWSMITTSTYYACVYRYLYQNPLRASLCDRVEQYPFSLWNPPKGLRIIQRTGFDEHISQNPDELSLWINDRYSNAHKELIQKGLRRRQFKPPRHPQNKVRVSDLDFL